MKKFSYGTDLCHRLAIYRHLVHVIAIFDNIFITAKSARTGFACNLWHCVQQEKGILEFCQVLPRVAIAVLPGNWQISAQNSSAPYTICRVNRGAELRRWLTFAFMLWCGPPSHRHIWTVANLVRWGQIFSKRFCLTICLVELFIDQKEVFLDTKANFGPEFALTIVDIHCRGISLLVIWHVNSVPFGICWPIWRGQEK